MKSVRLTSVIAMVVFCLLALQVHVAAQELQLHKHSFAELIHDTGQSESVSETSTPDPLTATTVRLTPTHLNFGPTTVGDHSSAQTVTLTNAGTSSLSIYRIAITGTDPTDFAQTHTCGTKLARGAVCIIKVTFYPKALGMRTAALSIYDNGGSSPQMVSLSGPGIAPGCIPQGGECRPYHRCCPGLTCRPASTRAFCEP